MAGHTDSDVRLRLEVRPGADEDRFPDGFNAWRGRIGVRVQAVAREGEANRAVVGVVAQALGVPAACVVVESGERGRRKTVRVEGLDAACVERLLEPALGVRG